MPSLPVLPCVFLTYTNLGDQPAASIVHSHMRRVHAFLSLCCWQVKEHNYMLQPDKSVTIQLYVRAVVMRVRYCVHLSVWQY